MRPFIDELTPFVMSHDTHLVSSPLQWILHSNGSSDLNDNIIFLGFEGNQTKPALVAKVPRLPSNGRMLQTEYERLTEAWRFIGDSTVIRVPNPIAMGELNQQPVLVISYVSGENLLYSTGRRLWNDTQRVTALFEDAARSLRELKNRTVTRLMDSEQIPSDILQKIEKFREIYSLTEKEEMVLSDLADLCSAMVATHKTMIHGDFWHGNIIRGLERGRLVLIDWQYSRWATDVSLDVYLFPLAAALASTPQGSAEERARWLVDILIQWKPKIFPSYLYAYGTTNECSLLPPRFGMLVCCLEKAVRAVVDFGYHQSDDLIWRCLFTELINTPERDLL